MRGIKPLHIKKQKRLLSFNRRFFCCLVLFTLITVHGFSQQIEDFTNSLKQKRSFYFTWDAKTTFITNEYAQVKSVKLGLDFGGKTKFGVGYNWYKGHIVREFTRNKELVTANLKFRYVTVFAEYVYFLNERWEATIPAQAGIGILQYNKEFTKEKVSNAGGLFFIYEPSSTITYRFLRYFGVGVGIGFRLVLLAGDNPQNEIFHSPLFSFRTKIYFEYVMRDFKRIFLNKP